MSALWSELYLMFYILSGIALVDAYQLEGLNRRQKYRFYLTPNNAKKRNKTANYNAGIPCLASKSKASNHKFCTSTWGSSRVLLERWLGATHAFRSRRFCRKTLRHFGHFCYFSLNIFTRTESPDINRKGKNVLNMIFSRQ